MAQSTATTNFGWQDFYSTTLSSSISSTDTTIPVVAAPTPTEGILVIEPDSSTNREIIMYTSVSGSNVVCGSTDDRGISGTTAKAHSAGAIVKMNTAADMFEVLQSGKALSSSSITTAKIADDAVTDAKLIYGKIKSRQGGSATNWQTAGSTTYDYSATDTVMVAGVSTLTAQSTAIGFGYTFGQNPIVLASPTGSSGVFSAGWYVVSVSTTQFTFVAADYAKATPLQWLAIGVPA